MDLFLVHHNHSCTSENRIMVTSRCSGLHAKQHELCTKDIATQIRMLAVCSVPSHLSSPSCFLVFLLPLHCKCSHLITHVRKMWFKMFESDVYFGWMSRSIINLQGALTALCRGSESSLQVCWKLTIFQHFSPATPTTWHLSREEEDRRQMFCQGK